MNIDYNLSRPKQGDQEGAVANLLAEADDAGEDLLETVAAWNLDIVDYLLVTENPGSSTVARQLIAGWPGEYAREFLGTFFTAEHTQGEKLAALLARTPWRHVYTYLVGDDDVPTTVRTKLVDAALGAFDPEATYDLGDDVREYITSNYRDMPVFSHVKPTATVESTDSSNTDGDAQDAPADQAATPYPGRLDDGLAERLEEVLARADIVIPDLKPLMADVRARVVESDRYQLTADNLRTALGLAHDDAITLEAVSENETVYQYCLANLGAYLGAVDTDTRTQCAVTTPETLVAVLDDLAADFDDDQSAAPSSGEVAELLTHTSTSARVRNLHAAPRFTWTALAAANLFRASLANLETYRAAHVDAVDEYLGGVLERAGRVYVDEHGDTTDADGNEYDRQAAAVAILNASRLPTQVRVDLVNSLEPTAPLPVGDIGWEASDLFALLLGADLVADDEVTFAHLRAGGWAALGPAIKVSGGLKSFLNPDLLDSMVGDALSDTETATKVAGKVLADVNGYVSEDDWAALKAVAVYADKHSVALDPAVVVRIARVGDGRSDRDVALMLRLLDAASPAAVADHVVETFMHLGAPYNRVTNVRDSFDLDFDDVHDRLLKVLQSENRISRGYPRIPRRRYSVTVN